MTIRDSLLARPAVYRNFKRLVQLEDRTAGVAREFLKVDSGGSVLDLGCGYGDWATFFVPGASYLGVDHNEAYINVARKLNAANNAQFAVADVSDDVVASQAPYDLVFLSGVLHHLDNGQVAGLCSQVAPLLRDSGRMVAFEPVFEPNQRLSARLIIAADRGRFVRDEPGYRSLLEKSFDDVDAEVVTGVLRIPYTHVILQARMSVADD
jgi:2-polyprenyl-3-methyl-5-hydroxy-6-metoxy-1,4-benzoquinol methylase